MTEAEKLRAIIASLYERIGHGDLELTQWIARAYDDSQAVPRDCSCGEAMKRLKTNWHCAGCGRSREL